MSAFPCPDCGATGKISAFVDYGEARPGELRTDIPCATCGGGGKVSWATREWKRIGADHRGRRVASQESILACANRIGISCAQLSAMERGRADPAPLLSDMGVIK
jgi:hypothetical protein